MITTQTLKNAARAMGYDLWSDPDGSHYLVDYDGVKLKRWDPEHDDGDAFRLAASLRLGVDIRSIVVSVEQIGCESISFIESCSNEDESRAKAARLAIVRAASSIGESLCQS